MAKDHEAPNPRKLLLSGPEVVYRKGVAKERAAQKFLARQDRNR